MRIKDFYKYNKKILKDSYLLLTKYFLVGIFWIIITLISNKFAVGDLTYFNAIFSLMIFSSIIPFGISQGISIYINQNIDDLEEVKKNIKLGFLLNLVGIILYISCLLIFKSLIFKHLIIINIPDNYVFFYMMIPVISMVMICDYFSSVFKILLESKSNLFFCLADFGLTLAAILITSIFQELTLTKIAWCYIATKAIFIPFFLVYAFKYLNKKNTFNLLEFKKVEVKATPKKIKKIISFGVSEIIWNVSFTLSGLVLLKNSEVLYNSYNYFSSTLDMIFGLYYAAVAICSISICNRLGKNEFDEAYKEGKYTLILTVLIWIIIFIISIIASSFIFKGMNLEIVETGRMILIPFLIITLIRFVDWTLSTYIISNSGIVNRFIYFNSFALAYYIILFILVDYITINPVLLIFLLGFDSFISIIINFPFFKSKKWLVNLND